MAPDGMNGPLEREVKLRADSCAEARGAIEAAGGRPLRERRLQSDAVLDTAHGDLRTSQCALRVRVEPGRCFLTFKGPPQPSVMKLREELETEAGDATVMFAILERLGYRVQFRYQKFREEFRLGEVIVAVDDTPIGAFIEIEGREEAVASAAVALGYGPADYIVDSYRTLYVARCVERGVEVGDMVFEGAA
jgi:adenylate cyclase class 2